MLRRAFLLWLNKKGHLSGMIQASAGMPLNEEGGCLTALGFVSVNWLIHDIQLEFFPDLLFSWETA